MANTELALAYATLILVDAKKELSAAHLESLVTKAGVKLPKGVSASFAKALKGKDVNSFYAVSGGGSSAPVAADTKKADVKKEDKKAAVPEPEPEEENVDMGGLFD